MGARSRAMAFAIVLVAGSMVALVLPAPPGRAAPQVSAYMTGLDWPVALAFSTDGRIFFAELWTGQIRIIENDTLLPTPFYTLTDTAINGEQGLLGLTLDPQFPASPWVYAYQTYDDVANGTVYNRIVRIRATGDTGAFDRVLLAGIPAAFLHNGGPIEFGPDGMLYALSGEAGIIENAQDLRSLGGKVLRMTRDGSVPPDNPFINDPNADPYVYTYGHRSIFGLDFHFTTGKAYITENGPDCNDEVNILEPGRNYGWGLNETCSTPPDPPVNTNLDGPSPVLPIAWYTPTTGPTNAIIYGGRRFTTWRGDMIFGEWHTGDLRRLDLEPPAYDAVVSQEVLANVGSGILDVEEGPDGAIWFTTPDAIYRLYDAGPQPPVASFTAGPNPTDTGVIVSFDASPSYDPDGTIVAYDWDFGDTTAGSGVTATHAYSGAGTYTVVLNVTDNASFSDTATVDVVVHAPSAQPPVAVFFWNPDPPNPGIPVQFDGSPSYDPDGTIVAYDWDFGDLGTGTGVTSSHAYAQPGTYLTTLTVTDDGSMNGSFSASIFVNGPPHAAFGYAPATIYIGVAVTFDGSASTDDNGVTSWSWDFGDTGTGTGIQAPHTYARKGTFTVRLTVGDFFGLTNSSTMFVQVRNRAPVIVSSVPGPGPVRGTVSASSLFEVFAEDPDNDMLTYVWRVDGTVAGGDSTQLVVTRDSPGIMVVNVTVSDGSAATWREWVVTFEPGTPIVDHVFPWLAVAGVTLAVATIIAVVVLLWRRRRRATEQAPPPPPSGP